MMVSSYQMVSYAIEEAYRDFLSSKKSTFGSSRPWQVCLRPLPKSRVSTTFIYSCRVTMSIGKAH
ncbi:hypothetical protein M406DRAFT_98846 [Cryphonectria parasitica EP155]|uniref:Uncharacterized protein n=1 Tax=Cryphonectria parasitica (strain ATCC 38755 / EP155) TaxID=660469 RepID=A0A9P4Y8N3_CRYP1|nr:uncharacterized protein M406DRAFT_98846 [Cryphonectria parasitica EP155]KAF3768997.1 hypothetical protein M406DRAFT_98846 [Cryphonectria parasitica EP155]